MHWIDRVNYEDEGLLKNIVINRWNVEVPSAPYFEPLVAFEKKNEPFR